MYEMGAENQDPKHTDVPKRPRRPVKFPALTTPDLAMDYASAGFHVSVDRMNGSVDPNVRRLWTVAALNYQLAYSFAANPKNRSMTEVLATLARANTDADDAYKAEAASQAQSVMTSPPGAGSLKTQAVKQGSMLPLALIVGGVAVAGFLARRKKR